MLCNPRAFGRCPDFSEMFFFSGVESSAHLSSVAQEQLAQGVLHTTFVCDSSEGVNFGA